MHKNEEGDLNSGKRFSCERCVDTKEGIMEPGRKYHFLIRLTL